MHLHIEESEMRRSDSTIHSLSWMGKVPDTSPDAEGWKLQRSNYYQEGWLATGNSKGLVGATFTACHCKKTCTNPGRTNFNLRGHRSEVCLVRWNEPYQKLATCDYTGMIFVWIKHEGRWSIELINDRNSQVTDFSWSHDGRMALICYRDGFVLVGSVTGQRFWSSTLALDSCITTCAIWSPDDQQVLFGTSDGQVIVMSSTGAMLTQSSVGEGHEIVSLAWSCEKFNLSEDGLADNNNSEGESQGVKKTHTLAVNCHSVIYLMNHLDDICPRVIYTGLTGVKVEWSNDGELLAVGGFKRWPNLECRNELRFYNKAGVLRYRLDIEKRGKPLTALTWGHNDRRLFIAIGCYVVTVWLAKKIAPLQFLCHRSIQRTLSTESCVRKLPLPGKLRNSISALFCPTIKGYIPSPHKLREFVCMPPPHSERLYCTLQKWDSKYEGVHYTLYLEFLGGLIPLLKGRRASKLRPEFVIYDPKIRAGKKCSNKHAAGHEEEDLILGSSESEDNLSDQSHSRVVHEMPENTPRKCHRKQMYAATTETSAEVSMADLLYCDNLPENERLLEITSNIWGTKFKIQGVASFLPLDVAMVTYKTSLLHLQPRQMTVTIVELSKEAKELRRKRTKTSPHQIAACPSSPTSTVAVQTEGEADLASISSSSLSASDRSPCIIHCHKHQSIEHCRHVHKSLHECHHYLNPTTRPSDTCPPVVHAKRPFVEPHQQLPPTPTHHRRRGRRCHNPYLAELESIVVETTMSVPLYSTQGHPMDSRSRSRTGHSDGQSTEGDSPPPQLKSPGRSGGFKSRSLSPAEQLSGPFMMDGGSGGPECVSVLSREMFSDSTLTVKKRVTTTQSPKLPSRFMASSKGNFDTMSETYMTSPVLDCHHGSIMNSHHPTGKRNPSILDAAGEDLRQQQCSVHEQVDLLDPGRSQTYSQNHSIYTTTTTTNTTTNDSYDRNRWADRPLVDLKYIDDDVTEMGCHSPEKKDTVYAKSDDITAKSILRESSQKPVAEYSLSQLETQSHLAQRLSIPEMETNRRVILSQLPVSTEEFRGKDTPVHRYQIRNRGSRCIEVVIDESHKASAAAGGSNVSIDSYESDASNQTTPQNSRPPSPSCFSSGPSSPSLLHRFPFFGRRSSSEDRNRGGKDRASSATRVEVRRHSMGLEACQDRKESASLPSSPVHKAAIYQNSLKCTKTESSKKSAMHSKLLSPRSSNKRIKNYNCSLESSDEESSNGGSCTEERQAVVTTTSENYSNLASFQKAQLSKKMRKARSRKEEESTADRRRGKSPKHSPAKTPTNSPGRKSGTPANSQQYLVMHNKAPLWNENSQVYQLDFGGRVTQESAKNFQIEYQGKQVMQFGRIDTFAYTLDFQYPFSAAQAFAVALANVTQRLK